MYWQKLIRALMYACHRGDFHETHNFPTALGVDLRYGVPPKLIHKNGMYWQKLIRALMYACHRGDFHETHACSTTFRTDLVHRIS